MILLTNLILIAKYVKIKKILISNIETIENFVMEKTFSIDEKKNYSIKFEKKFNNKFNLF